MVAKAFLFFFFIVTAAAAAGAGGFLFCTAATAVVRASDALFAAFLCFVNIEYGKTDDNCQNSEDDKICHGGNAPFL